jgi:hypothetical protein
MAFLRVVERAHGSRLAQLRCLAGMTEGRVRAKQTMTKRVRIAVSAPRYFSISFPSSAASFSVSASLSLSPRCLFTARA